VCDTSAKPRGCASKRSAGRQTLVSGRIHSVRGWWPPESPRRQRRGVELRWMRSYTAFSTLDTRYDDEE
jgi:hypothetical protein